MSDRKSTIKLKSSDAFKKASELGKILASKNYFKKLFLFKI
jgi:hypothetical protein